MKTKLLGKIMLFASVSLLTIEGYAQDASKFVKQNYRWKGKPSLIVFNKQSTYKSSDAEKVFTEQLGLKKQL
jgi:hypothetical protein